MTVQILPMPEPPAPVPDAGLGAMSTGEGNLPLESVDIQATVTGLVAGVEVSQGFRNPHGVPLEATYIFPLPDRAAVTAMRMEAADHVVEAELDERGKAREDYDAAIAAGQRAAIAEEDRPDVFTMRVGNILPGETVTVRLTLAQPLPFEDGAALLRFPLVVAPRYIPGVPLGEPAAGAGTQEDTDAVPDASRITPPVLLPGFPNPVRLSLTVDLDTAGLPVSQIHSSLHVTTTEAGDDGRTRISLRPGERLDRDFILRLGFDPQETAALAVVPDDEDDEGVTFALTVLPAGDSTLRPRDVALVLDRSGSMGGWKIVAARRAAARIVDTLTAADRFAVFSFDHTVERPRDLAAGLVPASDRNRFRAVEHLAALEARGGTEMLRPLDEAAHLLTDQTRDRVLVLITDGQVGNEDQLLNRLAPLLSGVRVHTIGIDRAVNAGFLTRLAQIGQGRAELVESEDRLDEAMEHIHHRIGAPVATGLTLSEEDGLRVDTDTIAPRRLGALYPGVPLVIYGRCQSLTGALVLRGTAADGSPWEQRATAVEVKTPAATAVWARAHLRDLEDQYAVKAGNDLEQQIIATSLGHHVLCRFTAFVAIDSRVVTEGGTPHKVVQPVEQPSGWTPQAPPVVQASFGAGPRGTARAMMAKSAGGPPPPAPMMPPPAGMVPQGAPAEPGGPGFGRPDDPITITPVPAGPGQSPAEVLADVRRQIAEEVVRLTASAHTPEPDRWTLLYSEHQYLLGHLARLRAAGVPAGPLEELAKALEVAGDRLRRRGLEELWDRTVAALTAFTGNPTPWPTPATPPRRPFWKRGT